MFSHDVAQHTDSIWVCVYLGDETFIVPFSHLNSRSCFLLNVALFIAPACSMHSRICSSWSFAETIVRLRMSHIGAHTGLGQWIWKCCAFKHETRKNYSMNLFISSFNTHAFDIITFFPRSFRSFGPMVKCKSERQTNNERNRTKIIFFLYKVD